MDKKISRESDMSGLIGALLIFKSRWLFSRKYVIMVTIILAIGEEMGFLDNFFGNQQQQGRPVSEQLEELENNDKQAELKETVPVEAEPEEIGDKSEPEEPPEFPYSETTRKKLELIVGISLGVLTFAALFLGQFSGDQLVQNLFVVPALVALLGPRRFENKYKVNFKLYRTSLLITCICCLAVYGLYYLLVSQNVLPSVVPASASPSPSAVT